jgi:hypothetical protein
MASERGLPSHVLSSPADEWLDITWTVYDAKLGQMDFRHDLSSEYPKDIRNRLGVNLDERWLEKHGIVRINTRTAKIDVSFWKYHDLAHPFSDPEDIGVTLTLDHFPTTWDGIVAATLTPRGATWTVSGNLGFTHYSYSNPKRVQLERTAFAYFQTDSDDSDDYDDGFSIDANARNPHHHLTHLGIDGTTLRDIVVSALMDPDSASGHVIIQHCVQHDWLHHATS